MIRKSILDINDYFSDKTFKIYSEKLIILKFKKYSDRRKGKILTIFKSTTFSHLVFILDLAFLYKR